LHIEFAHDRADHARGDHDHVDVGRRGDQVEAHIVAAGPAERLARRQPRQDLLLPDQRLRFVGGEHQQDVAGGGRLQDRHRRKAVANCPFPVEIVPVADNHRDAAVAQIQRLRLPLVAIAQHRHRLARQRRQRSILVLVQLHLPPINP